MTLPTDEGLAMIRAHGSAEHWLAVLVTTRDHKRPSVSVVNAGILPHPVTGVPIVVLVARGGTAKLTHLRHDPYATLVFRAGWEWISVAGPVELAGPDDPLPGVDAAQLPQLLRDIYRAAGGSHPDLDTYDRVMVAERRTAVLITPTRFRTNPPGTKHEDSP